MSRSPCSAERRALPRRPSMPASPPFPLLPLPQENCLHAFALALHRRQRRLRVHLPAELTNRMLSLFDA